MTTARVRFVMRRSVAMWLTVAAVATCCRATVGFAEAPTGDERREIEMLIGAYYRAVAEENLGEVVSLHHCRNSFERDKITALVEQAFRIADSDFESIRVQTVELYPERNIGEARVGVEYRIRRFDGGETISGFLDAAVVLVRGDDGWRIGKVARAADLDLTAAASRFADLSRELEVCVPAAPVGSPEPLPAAPEIPISAAAPASAMTVPPSEAGAATVAPPAAFRSGGLTFFAVRQKATGQCVVVAGIEGIGRGDTIYGAFPEYSQAEEALGRQCPGR